MTEQETKLLPCPFCGGKAEMARYGTGRYSTQYRCTECSCELETSEEFNHGTEWNNRSLTAYMKWIEQTEKDFLGATKAIMERKR